MKPSVLDKLQSLSERLEEVTALLSTPEATAVAVNGMAVTNFLVKLKLKPQKMPPSLYFVLLF